MTAPTLPFLFFDRVWHVGSMNPEDGKTRTSQEGFCLSVSLAPDIWSSIARVGGPSWELSRPNAAFVDAVHLDEAARAAVMTWAVERGYAAAQTWHRAWSYDSEMEEWRFMSFATGIEAEEEAEFQGTEDDEEVPSKTGTAVDTEEGHVLTAAGMAALGRWMWESDAENGAILLYTREVLAPDDPEIMGVWWDEVADPDALSYPRGGILPERLGAFEKRIEDPGHDFRP